MSMCSAVRSLFRSGKKHDDSKVSIIFLFFMMVGIVLLVTLTS